MISAVILTKNEEGNIQKCLKSVTFCNEIIIIDDYSTDKTINRIENLKLKIKNSRPKIKIYKHKLNNNFSAQRNYGILKSGSDWVLFLDADEVVSKDLAAEILYTIYNIPHTIHGFYLKRQDIFLSKPLYYGETGDIKLLRLAKKETGRWKRKVHEYWDVKGPIGELQNCIIHKSHPDIHSFLDDINFYSTIHAGELKKEGKKASIVKIIIWPTGKFISNYFLRLGFLDGVEGFIMAAMMSIHSFLSWSKAWIN